MNKPPPAPVLLWATGRAACGKSTFVRIAEEECRDAMLDTISLCDEKMLFQVLDEDVDHLHHYHPHGDERFLFKSNHPFDEGIRRISSRLKRILEEPPAQTIVALVELARGKCNGIMNVTFERAISLIDPLVIQESHFFYLQSGWMDQLERNRAREADGQPHPPDAVMEALYSEDDFEYASKRIPFEVIENHGDLRSFEDEIRRRIRDAIAQDQRSENLRHGSRDR